MTNESSALRLIEKDATRPDLAQIGSHSILGFIGSTPLIELARVAGHLPDGVRLFAKGEHLNPGGSVKDRAALRMVMDGRASGRFRRGQTLLDASSGNTGIAYAMIGAALGFPVAVVLPENASEGRKDLLRSYGARLILTDRLEGTDGSQRVAREMVRRSAEEFFYPDQYNNDANWLAHFDTTGPEILRQTRGGVTHFVAAVGTSGTFMGVTRRLKRSLTAVRCVAVHPDSPLHGIEGMKHMETAIVPGLYDPNLADSHMQVSSEDALAMARRLSREEGLSVGISAGANVWAATQVAEGLDSGVVVTILCDSGDRYGQELFLEP